jgi:hypothetical protein
MILSITNLLIMSSSGALILYPHIQATRKVRDHEFFMFHCFLPSLLMIVVLILYVLEIGKSPLNFVNIGSLSLAFYSIELMLSDIQFLQNSPLSRLLSKKMAFPLFPNQNLLDAGNEKKYQYLRTIEGFCFVLAIVWWSLSAFIGNWYFPMFPLIFINGARFMLWIWQIRIQNTISLARRYSGRN